MCFWIEGTGCREERYSLLIVENGEFEKIEYAERKAVHSHLISAKKMHAV